MFTRISGSTTPVLTVEDEVAVESFYFDRLSASMELNDAMHESYALDQTRKQALALKASIEQFGMTPSLMAFANYDGSLNNAVALSPVASLESMSTEDLDREKASLIAVLESFGNSDDAEINANILAARESLKQLDASVEGIKDSAMFALHTFVGGPLYAIFRAADGKVLGSAADIKTLVKMAAMRLDVVKKMIDIAPGNITALMSMKAKLAAVGIMLSEDGSSYEWKKMPVMLKMMPFGESGITPEVFKMLVNEYDRIDKEYSDLYGKLDDKHGAPHKGVTAHIADDLDSAAFKDLMLLRKIAKSAKRFFSKEKPAE